MLKWLQKAKPAKEVEKKAAVLGLNDALSAFLLLGQQSGATAAGAYSLYEQSTAVSIPIDFIASCLSSLKPVVVIDKVKHSQHPVLDLLSRPSPYYTRELFFEVLAKDFLITNELCLVALGGISRPPIELQPINPRKIQIYPDTYGYPNTIQVLDITLPGNYVAKRNRNEIRYYQGNLLELKFIRGYSTKDNSLLRAQSPLLQASLEVRQHILGNSHNVKLLESGGKVSLVFNFAEDMTETEFEKVKERVRAQYGGSGGESIGVTAGSKLEIKSLGSTNKDMDFGVLQDKVKQAVALQYKFPLQLLSLDAATLNNYKEGKLSLYDDAVLPLADKIFAGLTDFLVPRFGQDPSKVKISYDIDNITSLAARRIDELVKRKSLAVETDNEIRAMMGREPYDGGNVMLKPANLVPVGTDLTTMTNAEPSPTLVRDGNEE